MRREECRRRWLLPAAIRGVVCREPHGRSWRRSTRPSRLCEDFFATSSSAPCGLGGNYVMVRSGDDAEDRWMVLFVCRVCRLRLLLAGAARCSYLSHLFHHHDDEAGQHLTAARCRRGRRRCCPPVACAAPCRCLEGRGTTHTNGMTQKTTRRRRLPQGAVINSSSMALLILTPALTAERHRHTALQQHLPHE